MTLYDLFGTSEDKFIMMAIWRWYGLDCLDTSLPDALGAIRGCCVDDGGWDNPMLMSVRYVNGVSGDSELPVVGRTYDLDNGDFVVKGIGVGGVNEVVTPYNLMRFMRCPSAHWVYCDLKGWTWSQLLGLFVDFKNLERVSKEDFLAFAVMHIVRHGVRGKERIACMS